MSVKIIKKLPTNDEIVKSIPISNDDHINIKKHREEICNILSGVDNRLIIIVGPCSAWPYEAVLTYADKLVAINEKVKDKLKIVMRSYVHKPRTLKGWAGPIIQPEPMKSANLEEGIKYARSLMVELTKKNLAIADEALFIENSSKFSDLLSWVAIGARSSENPAHRIFASSLDYPVGIKNPTNGSIKTGVNGVIVAQHSHTTIYDLLEVETSGNQYAHLVLRGGDGKPNYSLSHLEQVQYLFDVAKIRNPSIIIDVSHDNCLVNGIKQYRKQGDIIFEVLDIVKQNSKLSNLIKGFMIESFIKDGRQDINHLSPMDLGGLSITDPCLSLENTEEILLKLARIMS